MAAATCGWHVPAAYELALGSPGWHEVEHASFFLASILFWWPVVGVDPGTGEVTDPFARRNEFSALVSRKLCCRREALARGLSNDVD